MAQSVLDTPSPSHAHGGPVAPASRRTRTVLAAALIPAMLATLAGLFLLWPAGGAVPDRVPAVVEGATTVDATVLEAPPEGASVRVRLADGEESTMASPGPSVPLSPGDRIVAVDISTVSPMSPDPLVFKDHQRRVPVGWLAAAYAVVVLAVARWRGLAALAGLGIAFVVFLGFTMPALLTGESALGVALVTSSLVMFVTLYLAHGLSARTSAALLGTLLGLALTAGIGVWAAGATYLGAADHDAQFLLTEAPLTDLRGVALCGLVLAGMGVLNDVTITQASAVWELREVAPGAPRHVLFARAMRIGRDHIASTVYTIAFAYVGAALPLLMMVSLVDQSPVLALTSGEIAEEVVRTLVGSIGLVLAIPITTAIAALAVPGPARERVEAHPPAAPAPL
ncbi:YibE/F family protein [Myceligenerans pegani]|uniref:YibE/F family protein n=1 Tax=Myceligenerans pegani TaxID=2776917 RepID=A0ABR9N243_9MICO|nr:YibE/F family protein [Myceligenerans sp. TRM 65318]MBE1877725.1 YibE/F family protein [Myceligenerans sp. TRM 65318]MBE3019996.1 YibE/F family protein [Myceligenerans sp. TRM 65318]